MWVLGTFPVLSDAFVPGWKFSFKRHSFSYVIIPRKSCTTQPAFEGSKWLTVTCTKGSISLSQRKGAVTVLRKGEREICYGRERKALRRGSPKQFRSYIPAPAPNLKKLCTPFVHFSSWHLKFFIVKLRYRGIVSVFSSKTLTPLF